MIVAITHKHSITAEVGGMIVAITHTHSQSLPRWME
jgi:hypothetical protein